VAADVSSPPQALGLVDNVTTFADRFTFTVGGAVGQNLDAIVASASLSADAGLDITGFSPLGSNDALLSQGRSLRSGAVDLWTLAGSNLGAGNYTMRVDGNLVSDHSASFRGAMPLVPVPVPEPGTYGMMLGGLGILARRRKAMPD
jgi:hypothetical protein